MLTEDLKLPKRQENLHINGYINRKKKKKESGQGLCPGAGAVKEEMFPYLGKFPHGWGDQSGQRRSFGT